MTIWNHVVATPASPQPQKVKAWEVYSCPFCGTALDLIAGSRSPTDEDIGYEIAVFRMLEACSACGWWVATRKNLQAFGPDGQSWLWRSWGVLRDLDFSDISTPTEEVCRYLLAKYDDRFKIPPAKYEDVVASVFASCGYSVRVTSFSGDGGIDVFILDGEGNDHVGVQVKRYRDRIEAEQIRSLAGALLLKGVTQGIFVTTSEFRSGAESTAKDYRAKGLEIELWNASEFYDRLKLSQRSMYKGGDDPTTSFFDIWRNQEMSFISQDGWGY